MWEMQIPASSDGSAAETGTAAPRSTTSNGSTPRLVLSAGEELSGECPCAVHNYSTFLCDFNVVFNQISVNVPY